MAAVLTDEARERQREANRKSYQKNAEQRRAYYRALAEKRRNEDPEGYAAYQKAWRDANRERINEQKRKRRAIKPEKKYPASKERAHAYYVANKERVAERVKAWRAANPGFDRHRANLRRKFVRQATPAWANFDAMKAIYAEARRVSDETGIPHDVDHIVPIRGELVCGLHWEGNLQVLTEAENIRKRNKCP